MKLSQIVDAARRMEFATQTGTQTHAMLRHLVLGDKSSDDIGDAELVRRVRSNELLIPLFDASAMTEVPLAGIYNGRFISRRIDRMRIFDDERRGVFIDYKTDINRTAMRAQYVARMREYAALLGEIYPGYTVAGYILWLHDWTLDAAVGDVKNLENGPVCGL